MGLDKRLDLFCSEPVLAKECLGLFESRFRRLSVARHLCRDLCNERLYLLNVGVTILDDILDVTWYYSHELHERSTIEGLADGFMRTVRALLTAERSPQGVGP